MTTKIYSDEIKTKSKDRLLRLRKKYRFLLHTSHGGGAGGVRDSPEWRIYTTILLEIDRLLKYK